MLKTILRYGFYVALGVIVIAIAVGAVDQGALTEAVPLVLGLAAAVVALIAFITRDQE